MLNIYTVIVLKSILPNLLLSINYNCFKKFILTDYYKSKLSKVTEADYIHMYISFVLDLTRLLQLQWCYNAVFTRRFRHNGMVHLGSYPVRPDGSISFI